MRELNFSFHKNIRRNNISISFLRLGVSPSPGDTIRMTSCQVASENLATVLKNKNNSLAFFLSTPPPKEHASTLAQRGMECLK